MSLDQNSVVQSLPSLLKQTDIEDHEEVLRASNAALKKSKGDTEAPKVKVVALLKLDRYDDALRVLDEGGEALQKQAGLERAYALYRVGRLEEAVEIAKKGTENGMRHVEAQASYRAEDFVRAQELYKELQSQKPDFDNEENDVRINIGAVAAQLEWSGKGDVAAQLNSTSSADLDAFETAYNAACVRIAKGELKQADILLKRAIDLCNTSEDLTDEEKATELYPMLVQRLYIASLLGDKAGAKSLTSDVLIEKISDVATRQIAQNNLIEAASSEMNPYMAHKFFHSQPNIPPTQSLFNNQKKVLESNAYVLDLMALKYSGVASSTAQKISQSPVPTTSSAINNMSVIRASAVAKGASGSSALKHLKVLFKERPDDIGLLMTIIQLEIQAGDTTSPLNLLEGFMDRHSASSLPPTTQAIAHTPGLVAVLANLYQLRGQKSHARKALSRASAYWLSQPASQRPISLLRNAALTLLDSLDPSDHSTAFTIFTAILEQQPSNSIASLGKMASSSPSTSFPPDVDSLLPPVSRQIAGIDAAALEEAGIAKLPPLSAQSSSARKRSAAMATNQPLAKKKRLRKSRLPKDFDPEKKMDPERWLPLRDRSSYKPRGKKGKAKQAALTQGGIAKEAASEGGDVSTGGPGVVKADKGLGGGSKAGGKKKKGKK